MKINSGVELLQAKKEVENVDKIMETSNEISEVLDKNADILFSPFSEIAPDIKAVKETVVKDIAKMRSPEVLNTRITTALSENALNASAWDAASAPERITMTNKMFNIMLEEMQVPGQIRDKLRLWYFGSDSPTAGSQVFSNRYSSIFKPDAQGNLAIKDNPRVEMHYSLLYRDFDTAMGALYNQAIHIMQQATCLEPDGTYINAAEQAKWAAEVKDTVMNHPAVHNDMRLFAASAEKQMLDRYHKITKNKGIFNTHMVSFK